MKNRIFVNKVFALSSAIENDIIITELHDPVVVQIGIVLNRAGAA